MTLQSRFSALLATTMVVCLSTDNGRAQAPPAAAAGPTVAGATATSTWLDGDAFQRQLLLDASVLWQDAPLRERLARFAQTQKVAIWLDRRIDPNQSVTLQVQSQPLEAVIRKIADELDCGMCVVDSVVYVGPRETAARLASVVEQLDAELRNSPAEVRSALSEPTAAQWPLLTTPQEALQQSIAHVQPTLTWKTLDSVPHDLLPETHLPKMPVKTQLSLLLAGFDLSFTSTSPLQVVPLPEATVVARTYSVARSVMPQFQDVLKAHPSAKVTRQGSRFRIEGSSELHRQVRAALKPKKKVTTVGPPTKRYSLKVSQQPVGNVARQLAGQLGLQLQVDAAANAKLDQRISFDVKDVTRAELINAMLAPAGLRGEVIEGVLKVGS